MLEHRWSIVMLTMNSMPRTISSLSTVRRSIRQADGSIELIVVDNGSTDGLLAWLVAQGDLRTISNGKNLGVPRARNIGIDAAGGDAILFLDSDVDLMPRCIELLDRKLSLPDVGMAGDSGSVFVPEWAERGDYSHDMSDEMFPGVNFVVGYCMAIRRDAISAVGRFDESYPLYYWEDIDYGIRVRKAGFSIGVVSETCFHHGRTTVSALGSSGEVKRVEEAGRRRTLDKHRADCPTWALAISTVGEPGDVDDLREQLAVLRPNTVVHVVSPDGSVVDDRPWLVSLPGEMYPRSSYSRLCVWTGRRRWEVGPYVEPVRDPTVCMLNDPLSRTVW